MSQHSVAEASTTEGLPVSPGMGPTLSAADIPPHVTVVDRRTLYVSAICVGLGVIAAFVAQGLLLLIDFFTNLAFFGRLSTADATPAANHLGVWVIGVPVIGGLIVGVMARLGSPAIRGHGIPEAMEQVLRNDSRIPARMTLLKPLSAAIAIGTGGPFGAEGPIIATGGALGSLIGQVLPTAAAERKTLLAAGAAAGMTSVFGTPIAAVLLAVELLLFEFRPRSLVPVALAAAAAGGVRAVLVGTAPMFAMETITQAAPVALGVYVLLGAIIGAISVGVTRTVYAIEDQFERLPIHWMWWPAIGAVAVGAIGYFFPRTLGVGYRNITDILNGQMALAAVGALCAMKFISWAVSLGSGTSGGTMAPLFTIGSGLGAVLGVAAARMIPHGHIDPRVAALVGMVAMFAGASRALLASIVMGFELTRQPDTLLPLLGGGAAAYLASCLLMRHTMMTEKIARRGVLVPTGYAADVLDQLVVRDVASRRVVTMRAEDSVGQVRAWMESGAAGATHQGFPVVNEAGHVTGVLTRRDLINARGELGRPVGELIRRPPKIVYDDCTLRQAMDHLVNHDIGRLPVVRRADASLVGIVTRSDLLKAYRRRMDELTPQEPEIDLGRLRLVRR